MIKGIGTDIVSIERIEQVLSKNAEKFCARILHANELEDLPENHKMQSHFVAKRWAAKEAVAKAFGTGIGKEISFQDIEIKHNQAGVPQVKLSPHGEKIAATKNIKYWHLSISDEIYYAIAYVIASG